MAIKFLNIPAEEAVLTLSKIIEEGYQIKIGMDTEYHGTKQDKGGVDNSSIHELVEKWEQKANDWFVQSIKELEEMYTSKRMAYEFREAQPGVGYISDSDNPKWHTVSRSLGAKLEKLNQFDDFIKREFRVEIEYVAGDKYETHGKNSPIKSK